MVHSLFACFWGHPDCEKTLLLGFLLVNILGVLWVGVLIILLRLRRTVSALYFMKITSLLLFLLISNIALADEALCLMADNISARVWNNERNIEKIIWKKGNYSYFNSNMNRTFRERSIQFTHVDIDNNGVNDTVIKSWGGISGHIGANILIVKNKIIDLSTNPNFGNKKLTALHSYLPWPYKEYGVYLANITIISHKKNLYVLLTDTQKRGYVLGSISNVTLIEGQPSPFNDILLKPICGKKYNN